MQHLTQRILNEAASALTEFDLYLAARRGRVTLAGLPSVTASLLPRLIADAVKSGELKNRASSEELARFALAAIAASAHAGSKPAVHRLVRMILRGLGAA